MSKVLVLASYCGSENKKCSDINPCRACMDMCNVFDVPSDALLKHPFVAQFDNFKHGAGKRSPQKAEGARHD